MSLYLLLTLVISFGAFTILAIAEDRTNVLLNGTELAFDVPPQLICDRTMVLIRKIFELLVTTVKRLDDTQTIRSDTDDRQKMTQTV